jgi:hypothetical protein
MANIPRKRRTSLRFSKCGSQEGANGVGAEKGQIAHVQLPFLKGRHFAQVEKSRKVAFGAICQFNTCAVFDFDASALDDDRMVFALGGGVDIEHLTFVFRLGVGKATVDFWLRSEERGGKEEDEEGSDGAHGCVQNVGLVYSPSYF